RSAQHPFPTRRSSDLPQGEPGVAGPSADPRQVAEIAAEIVKKAQIAKFQTLLNELEAEIGAVKAALRWTIIEELKLSGFVDAERSEEHTSELQSLRHL